MKTNFLKKGRTLVAMAVSVAMIFATVSYPVSVANAKSEDDPPIPINTPGVTFDQSTFGKIEPAKDMELTSPQYVDDFNDFIFIKQNTADSGYSFLWTPFEISNSLRIDILAQLAAYDGSLKSISIANTQYAFGYYSIPITVGDVTNYYTFSHVGSQYKIEFTQGKISHITFGQYNFEEPKKYDFSVTKAVKLNGELATDDFEGTTVYVTLYKYGTTDSPRGELVGTLPIIIADDSDPSKATAVFDDLLPGKYFLEETKADGTPIQPNSDFLGYYLTGIDYSKTQVITIESTDVQAEITNNLIKRNPDEIPLLLHKEMIGKKLSDIDSTFTFKLYEIVDNQEVFVQEATADSTTGNIEFEAIPFAEEGDFYYVVREIKGTDTRITYDDNEYSFQVHVDIEDDSYVAEIVESSGDTTFTNTYNYGKISVTKKVTFPVNEQPTSFNEDFYVTLFMVDNDELKALETKVFAFEDLNDMNSGLEVSFENLELDKSYIIYETNGENYLEDGLDGVDNIIDVDEDLPFGDWINIKYEGQEIDLTSGENGTKAGSATITNVYDPEDRLLTGSITIKKFVTLNGEPLKTNRTFYVALFTDKKLSSDSRITEALPLKMSGKSETQITIAVDKDGEYLRADTIYYVAETDKAGLPISDSLGQLGCTISIDKSPVSITSEEEEVIVSITNKFKKEEFPVTGDNSNMNLWLFLAVLGVAGAIAPFALRKREEIND